MNRSILAIAGFCVVMAAAGTFVALHIPTSQPPSGSRLEPLAKAYTDRTNKGYWTLGSTRPTVIVTEYADYQCPYCQTLSVPLEQAVNQTSGVQLQFRPYPLTQLHNKALQAAEAAEAAGRQGKFWQMHDKLFATQSTWEDDIPSSFQSQLDSDATNLGLDVTQFDRDMADTSLQTPITNDIASGDKIPVEGTPTLIVNGSVIADYPTTVSGLENLFKTVSNAQSLQ